MSGEKKLELVFLSYDFHIHYFRTIIDELRKHPLEFKVYIETTIENLNQRPKHIFFASGCRFKEFPHAIKIQVFHSCLISKGVQYHPSQRK